MFEKLISNWEQGMLDGISKMEEGMLIQAKKIEKMVGNVFEVNTPVRMFLAWEKVGHALGGAYESLGNNFLMWQAAGIPMPALTDSMKSFDALRADSKERTVKLENEFHSNLTGSMVTFVESLSRSRNYQDILIAQSIIMNDLQKQAKENAGSSEVLMERISTGFRAWIETYLVESSAEPVETASTKTAKKQKKNN